MDAPERFRSDPNYIKLVKNSRKDAKYQEVLKEVVNQRQKGELEEL